MTTINISLNGFTEEFENKVLKAGKRSGNKDLIWKTEEDVDRYFNTLKNKTNVENPSIKKIQRRSSTVSQKRQEASRTNPSTY